MIDYFVLALRIFYYRLC